MTGQQNTDRIMTTHVGSLPRPHDLLDMMKARLAGGDHDEAAYQARVRAAVMECVRRQTETGIDIVCDGEQSKSGFFTYARERLDGFEPRPQRRAHQCSPPRSRRFRNTTNSISAPRCWAARWHRWCRWCAPARSAIAARRRCNATSTT